VVTSTSNVITFDSSENTPKAASTPMPVETSGTIPATTAPSATTSTANAMGRPMLSARRASADSTLVKSTVIGE